MVGRELVQIIDGMLGSSQEVVCILRGQRSFDGDA